MANNLFIIYKTRITAIVLIAAGYGWAGGHYIPANSPFLAYIFQLVIIVLLLMFGIAFVNIQGSGQVQVSKSRWPVKALGIFAVVTLAINIANIMHGALSSDPQSYGSHNTLADLVPICIIMAGDILWLITLMPVFNSRHQQLQ